MPSFRRIAAAGFRTVNAVWIAPVLLFVILAPQQTGTYAEILVLRASGRQLPPELIAMAIIGHTSFLWLPVLFFGLPWVIGGAAAQFRDHLIPPERRRSYIEQASSFYGRSFVLLVLLGVLLAALFVPLYALPMWLMVREGSLAAERIARSVMSMTSHPAMIAAAIAWWLVAAILVAAWNLVVAAMVVEDLSPFRALQRGLSFVRGHRGDTARLWLFVMLIGLPNVLLQPAIFLVPTAAISLSVIAISATAHGAYALMLSLAVAESLSLARRPVIVAG